MVSREILGQATELAAVGNTRQPPPDDLTMNHQTYDPADDPDDVEDVTPPPDDTERGCTSPH